jgi:hypothetical protein
MLSSSDWSVFSTLRCPDISGIHEDLIRRHMFLRPGHWGKSHLSAEVLQIGWFGRTNCAALGRTRKTGAAAFRML